MSRPDNTRPTRKLPTRRDALETRKRLLKAAKLAFARSGFHGASVREICTEAEANVSAVRHYFEGKEGLYRAVLVSAVQEMRDSAPIPDFDPVADPEGTVREWVRFYSRLLLVYKAGNPIAGNLIGHELKRPTEALDDILNIVVRPVRRPLEEAIGVLLGPADSQAQRMHCAGTVQSIILARELGKAALNRLGALPVESPANIEAFATEVTIFSLGGIRAIREAAVKTRQ